MIVIIDGKEVECKEAVTVIYNNSGAMVEGKEVNLHVKSTYEGIIVDAIDDDGEICATCAMELQDLADKTH